VVEDKRNEINRLAPDCALNHPGCFPESGATFPHSSPLMLDHRKPKGRKTYIARERTTQEPKHVVSTACPPHSQRSCVPHLPVQDVSS
jgi:hypothetical protein